MVSRTQRAYTIATAYHETAFTLNPVSEAFWLKDQDAYLKKHHPEYYPFYGRGFVQLTWDYNYKKYEKILNIPLFSNPELALDPDVAAFILVHGLITGGFARQNISDHINDYKIDFFNARRCVNWLDKAQQIAIYAIGFIDRV